jgi:hypothetical protein
LRNYEIRIGPLFPFSAPQTAVGSSEGSAGEVRSRRRPGEAIHDEFEIGLQRGEIDGLRRAPR